MSDRDITVGSAHVELGPSFRSAAQERIRQMARKYFGDLTMGSVHVAQEGLSYRCSVNVQMGGLPMVSAEAMGRDVYMALGAAAGKVEKQLRRSKRLLREDRPNRPSRTVTA